MSDQPSGAHERGPWLERARRFLDEAERRDAPAAQVLTLQFLVEGGHVGLANRTTEGSVLNFLNDHDAGMGLEEWQHNVLGPLKREGIVATLIAPGPQGGVFIPLSEQEMDEVREHYLSRATALLENLRDMIHHGEPRDAFDRTLEATLAQLRQLRNAIGNGRGA